MWLLKQLLLHSSVWLLEQQLVLAAKQYCSPFFTSKMLILLAFSQLTYPLVTARTKLQAQGNASGRPILYVAYTYAINCTHLILCRYTGTWDALVKTVNGSTKLGLQVKNLPHTLWLNLKVCAGRRTCRTLSRLHCKFDEDGACSSIAVYCI